MASKEYMVIHVMNIDIEAAVNYLWGFKYLRTEDGRFFIPIEKKDKALKLLDENNIDYKIEPKTVMIEVKMVFKP